MLGCVFDSVKWRPCYVLNSLSQGFHHGAQFRCQVSLYEICGGQSDTGAGFSLHTLFLFCLCHSASAPYSYFSSVSVILPVLHIHISFTYYWCYYRSCATRVSQLKIWHFWVIGIERNICGCTFSRYSVITQFEKLATVEQLCRCCTHRKL